MAHEPLVNYLKTFRLQTGFTDDDVAFLLGGMAGSTVSRHENGKLPSVKTVLAYYFILGVPVHGLYEGLAREIQILVQTRARGMRHSFLKQPQTPKIKRKIEILDRILIGAKDLDEAA